MYWKSLRFEHDYISFKKILDWKKGSCFKLWCQLNAVLETLLMGNSLSMMLLRLQKSVKCLERQQYFNLVDTLLDDSLARINSYLVSKPCGVCLPFGKAAWAKLYGVSPFLFKCFSFVILYHSIFVGWFLNCGLNVIAASNSRKHQIGWP